MAATSRPGQISRDDSVATWNLRWECESEEKKEDDDEEVDIERRDAPSPVTIHSSIRAPVLICSITKIHALPRKLASTLIGMILQVSTVNTNRLRLRDICYVLLIIGHFTISAGKVAGVL